MSAFESWGRLPKVNQKIRHFGWSWEKIAPEAGERLLPHGLGRSYGDSCLNDGGTLLSTRTLNNFISFDHASGIVRCEAGVSIEDLLQVCVLHGWFVPVSPGTRFVTLGGAVANDVHGKNHHRAGTFGRHVRAFGLLRSNGECFICSAHSEPDLFAATIGGLGLTGLILWVELQLIPIAGPNIFMESIKFSGLDEFFDISSASDTESEYTVAWLDCVARGNSFARGVFMRGNFAPAELQKHQQPRRKSPLAVPFCSFSSSCSCSPGTKRYLRAKPLYAVVKVGSGFLSTEWSSFLSSTAWSGWTSPSKKLKLAAPAKTG